MSCQLDVDKMAALDRNPPENQNCLLCWISSVAGPIRYLLVRMQFMELFFVKLHNIYAFTSQLLFFTLTAAAFEHDQPETLDKNREFILMALKTILFYSVFTYFVTKTREIWASGPSRNVYNWNFVEGLCKIAIEWAKAIVVVICLREQGINFKPKVGYAVLTLIYYLCTEKIFLETFLNLMQLGNFDVLEGMENFYVPLMMNAIAIVLNCAVQAYVVVAVRQLLKFTVLSTYFTVYIRSKDLYYNCWKPIEYERHLYDSFRNATEKELEDHDDICAVCLNRMSRAKITPCRHFFHPFCLKECLKTSYLCPICKLQFEIDD